MTAQTIYESRHFDQFVTSRNRTELIRQNSRSLELEIDWFSRYLAWRMEGYFAAETARDTEEPVAPSPEAGNSLLGELIRYYRMNSQERLVLILGLLPHLRPQALDLFFTQNSELKRGFSEFGGVTGLAHSGFLPTGETAVFLLAGSDLEKRFAATQLFSHEHFFCRANILHLSAGKSAEPFLSGTLKIAEEWLELLTAGRVYEPPYTSNFPAKRITTPYKWDELILEQETLVQIEDILSWLKHSGFLMEDWKLRERLAPGYKAFFHGPSGTGKTLTASLIGKLTGMNVYRIDLSMVISKYIGETEKNLAALFDQAENKNWLLFFDEADALFSERTKVITSNDRSANQEIAYLLQRVEIFPGVVILASNLSGNIDTAFLRRFQTVIHFPIPAESQRLLLWELCFKDKPYPLAEDISLETLAGIYELSGGNITNILRYACLQAVSRNPKIILKTDILQGIKNELTKIGRLFRE